MTAGGKINPGDIVYCLRGSTIGKTARNHFAEGAIASSLVIVRAKANACQGYLYFYLTSPLGRALVQQHDNGSAQPNLSVETLSKYPLPLPPVAEQLAIAHILGALDDKIEVNHRMNETLAATARAIFQDWFVDFGPTRGKMGGLAPYLAPDVWALFPDRLDGDGKPASWPRLPMGAFFRLERGLSYKGAFLTEHGVSMINLGCFLGNGLFDREKLKPYSGEIRPRHRVRIGDLVLANTDMTKSGLF